MVVSAQLLVIGILRISFSSPTHEKRPSQVPIKVHVKPTMEKNPKLRYMVWRISPNETRCNCR